MPLADDCEGAAENFRLAGGRVCDSCGFRAKLGPVRPNCDEVCPRCSTKLPLIPCKPLTLDWRKVLCSDRTGASLSKSAAEVSKNVGFFEKCMKMNKEGLKERQKWKRSLVNNNRVARDEGLQEHMEVLSKQLSDTTEGGLPELWHFLRNEAAGGARSVRRHSSRKVNEIISMAATMRLQCFIRRWLAGRRLRAMREEMGRRRLVEGVSRSRIFVARKHWPRINYYWFRSNHPSPSNWKFAIENISSQVCAVQRIWRGFRLRRKLKQVEEMKFDYVDDELDELLEGGDLDIETFLERDMKEYGAEEGEGDWKPKKPIATTLVPSAVSDRAWRTPTSTPLIKDRASMVAQAQPEREISSPFGGIESNEEGQNVKRDANKDDNLDLVSMNLKRNGFDFSPPLEFCGRKEESDMEIKSVTTAAPSERESCSGNDPTAANNLSLKERKKEALMKDWGLTDSRVAQAMMKRARKMNKGKRNGAKKLKMKDAYYR